jgi:DNA-binding winged helix-turn-helix (wHTH) protein
VQGDFRINEWLIQPQINSVEKNGETWHLEPKVMQVLVQLASHPNQVLSKEKLLDAVWHDTFVGDDVLVRCISEIRYVFGDDPRSSRVIQTIPKGGYRLIAPVSARISMPEDNLLHYYEPSVPIEHPPLNGNGHSSAEVAYVSETSLEKTEPRDAAIAEREVTTPASHPAHAVTKYRNLAVGLGALLVILLGFWGGTYAWKATHKSALDSFWDPILSGNEPVLFCIADQNQYSALALRDADDPSHVLTLKDNLTAVVMDDLNAVIQITGILKANGKKYMKGEGATNFKDLQNGPTIFVGAFDNMWTLRLTRHLRFRFANNQDMSEFSIVDTASPTHKSWTVHRVQQMSTNNYRDYAIVARFTDANTQKPALIVAGISRGGTIAAGEFVTNPEYLTQLAYSLRNAGNKKNLEVVLSTPIIDGLPGPPQIEALYTW